MAEYIARLVEIICSYEMCHLDGEAHGGSTRHTTAEPGARLNQSAGCSRLHTDSSHHGLIDEEHHDAGDLRQDGRNTQLDDQVEFLTACHGLSTTDHAQQHFTLLIRHLFAKVRLSERKTKSILSFSEREYLQRS